MQKQKRQQKIPKQLSLYSPSPSTQKKKKKKNLQSGFETQALLSVSCKRREVAGSRVFLVMRDAVPSSPYSPVPGV